MIGKIKKWTKKNNNSSLILTKNWDEEKLKKNNFDIDKIEKNFYLIAKEIERELSKKISFQKLEISINLIDSKEIKNLNKIYRNKDKSTDVLSFPSGNLDDDFISKIKILDLGDIFINLDILDSQAKTIESNKEMEIVFLFMHGSLHLIGYDHLNEIEAEEMYSRQREILAKTKIRKENI